MSSSDVRDDRVCIVTGATSGIGRATAVALVARGARVTLLARDRERAEALARDIRRGAPGAAQILLCDLADLSSVRRATETFLRDHQRLDALVNCAAVFTPRRNVTRDGLELMFATNHLGPFVLTLGLVELLKKSAPSRVVYVTAPSTTQLDFSDLQGDRRFRALWAFGATKSANLLVAFALAERLRGLGVTVNAVHPGVTRTGLMREAPVPIRLVTRLIGGSAGRAAERVVAAALAPELAGVTGELLAGTRVIAAPAYAHDRAIQRRLWAESERVAGVAP